jgi:hypothetical protein
VVADVVALLALENVDKSWKYPQKYLAIRFREVK